MTHRLTTTVLLVLVALLAGCSLPSVERGIGDPSADGTSEVAVSDDGWFSVDLAGGWRQFPLPEDNEDGSMVLKRRGDRFTQVVATSFDTAEGAEEAAVWAAVSLHDGAGISCERREDDETFGTARLVFDCPSSEPEPYHKVLVPFVDGDRSVLVLVQADGVTLQDTEPVVRPVLDSFAWR